jgi:hypothetical protein
MRLLLSDRVAETAVHAPTVTDVGIRGSSAALRVCCHELAGSAAVGWMFQVPAVLAERAATECGACGRNWIMQLPEIITAARQRWSLSLGAVLPLGKQLSVLIEVTMPGGQPAVLKASYPDAGPQHEAAALARWAGYGAATLLGADPDRGLLLLEHLAADRSLLAEDDTRALQIAARILQQLRVPPNQEDSIPPAADLARRWLTDVPSRYHALRRPFETGLLHAGGREQGAGPRVTRTGAPAWRLPPRQCPRRRTGQLARR